MSSVVRRAEALARRSATTATCSRSIASSRFAIRSHRAFSTSSTPSSEAAPPQKHLFLVYAPDATDPDALARRLSVRSMHLANATVLTTEGVLKLGGALLTPESVSSPGAQKTMVGSTLIYEAETLEQVRQIVEADVYWNADVWDKEKLSILPFLSTRAL